MVLHARGEGVPCSLMSPLVIHRGLLATSSFVEGTPLVSLFVDVLGVFVLFFSSEFDHVRLMKALPKLLLVVVIVISSILLPLCCSCLGFSPVYRIEHIPKYSSIEKFMKLPFQQVFICPKRIPIEGVRPPLPVTAICPVLISARVSPMFET